MFFFKSPTELLEVKEKEMGNWKCNRIGKCPPLQISFRGNYSMWRCRFVLWMGGSEFRVLLCHHLELPSPFFFLLFTNLFTRQILTDLGCGSCSELQGQIPPDNQKLTLQGKRLTFGQWWPFLSSFHRDWSVEII